MPRKTRKSKAAEQREQNKREHVEHDMSQVPSDSDENISFKSDESINDYKVVSGTLHQGDINFQCPGIQCTYISFFALISMRVKDPSFWNGNDIDSCIIEGNDRFLEHCFAQNWQPKMLLVNELPRIISLNGANFECRQSDIDIATGTLDQPSGVSSRGISQTIDDAILKCFDISDSCLLVCGGQTIAVAKRENMCFLFDPHSRGITGLQHHSGSAVLASFSEIRNLIEFIRKLLIQSLSLKPSEPFELVPIFISEQQVSENEKVGSSYANTTNPVVNMGLYLENATKPHLASVDIKSHLASVDTVSPNLSIDQKPATTSMHNCAMDSYFTDQLKRDKEHRSKRSLNQNLDSCSKNMRRDYMRNYMQKKRQNKSFRKHDNLKAAERMQKIQSTEEGRQKHNKRSTERMQKLVSTEEGRQKHNKRSAEARQKMLSTEEGRQKHNKSCAEAMQKILSSEEGRQKHNKSSAEAMKKILSTKDGRQKHNKSCAKAMQKILITEEGRRKHNKRSAEAMKKILNT